MADLLMIKQIFSARSGDSEVSGPNNVKFKRDISIIVARKFVEMSNALLRFKTSATQMLGTHYGKGGREIFESILSPQPRTKPLINLRPIADRPSRRLRDPVSKKITTE